MADHLGAPLDVVPGGGHLNAETGFDAFPQLLAAVQGATAPGPSAPA